MRARTGFVVFLLSLTLFFTGCATKKQEWFLEQSTENVDYYTRDSHIKSLPEFKATITIDAPINQVSNYLEDFTHHPKWLYGCASSEIINQSNKNVFYIYQVSRLPLVTNRDLILRAKILRKQRGNIVEINIQSEPNYCKSNVTEPCKVINQSNYVRIHDAYGQFKLTKIDESTTRLEWRQFLDPAGSLPLAIYRFALPKVPFRSLPKLKQQIERLR